MHLFLPKCFIYLRCIWEYISLSRQYHHNVRSHNSSNRNSKMLERQIFITSFYCCPVNSTANTLKGLHWGFLTWWDWKYVFPDKCSFWCRVRPLIFIQNFRSFEHFVFPYNYSNCKRNDSNRATKSI
jgi:hypothetical protein